MEYIKYTNRIPNNTLCGFPGPFLVVIKITDSCGNDITVNDFLINQLKAGKVTGITARKNITDNTFVQPLIGVAAIVQ